MTEETNEIDQTIAELERFKKSSDSPEVLSELARLYERRGRGQDYVLAEAIYKHLSERTGAPEYFARLAQLMGQQNRVDEQRKYQACFEERFRIQNQTLTLPELLVAATQRFLPLDALVPLIPSGANLKGTQRQLQTALRQARALDDEQRATQLQERLALLLALTGQLEESSDHWRELMTSAQARPEHAKYFGAIRGEIGDTAGSAALLVSAIAQEDIADPEVLALLLRFSGEEVDQLVARAFMDENRRNHTLEALKKRARQSPSDPEPWLLLGRFERIIGQEEQADRHAAKAKKLEAHRNSSDIGKIKSAAVFAFGGTHQGFIHDIWVSRTKSGDNGGQVSIHGNVAQDMRRDIENAFEAAKKYFQELFPHLATETNDYRYALKVTKDDRTSDGDSAGAAVALAFLSQFFQRPIPQNFALTGRLIVDSARNLRIGGVGFVDHKVLGAHQRRLTRLIAPAENKSDLEESCVVPKDFWQSKITFVQNMNELLEQVFGEEIWDL